VLLFFICSCNGATDDPAKDGEREGDSSSTGDAGFHDATAADGGVGDGGDASLADTSIQPPRPPRFEDWNCPEDWLPEPAFRDEKGQENPPEGVSQFNICTPPADWMPVKLADWDCPEGWLAAPGFADENGTENPPEGLAQFHICKTPDVPACPDGEAAYPGETACHPIGTACPSADFQDEQAIRGLVQGFAGKILRVKPGAAGGDGSEALPYGLIADALKSAADGDIVALARGSFAENVAISRRVALVGACAGGSTMSPGANEDTGTVEVTGHGGALVANLTIAAPRPGIWVWATKNVTGARGVEIRGAVSGGILFTDDARGGAIENVAIRDNQPRPSNGKFGRALTVQDGAAVTVNGAVLERNRDAAVYVGVSKEGVSATLSLDRIVIRDNQSNEFTEFKTGYGIELAGPMDVTVRRTLVERNRTTGIYSFNPDAALGQRLLVEDTTIRDTRERESDGAFGNGIEIDGECKATIRRVELRRNRSAALLLAGTAETPTAVTVSDILIRDTQSRVSDKLSAYGIFALGGARVDGTRVVVARSKTAGITAWAETSDALPDVAIEDLVVTDTLPSDSDGSMGWGIMATKGAEVAITRVLIERSRGRAVRVDGTGFPAAASVSLSRVVVRDTMSDQADLTGGLGLDAAGNSNAVLNTALFVRNREDAISIMGAKDEPPTTALLENVVVRDTLPRETDPVYSTGLLVIDSPDVTVRRALFERSGELAIFANGYKLQGQTALTAEDIVVRDTKVTDPGREGGYGLVALDGLDVTVRRALFDRNTDTATLAGIMPGGQKMSLVLEDSVVRATKSRQTDLRFGRSLGVQDGAAAALSRVVLDQNRDVGIWVGAGEEGAPSSLAASDLAITGTRRAACGDLPEGEPGSCSEKGVSKGAGTALSVVRGSTASLERFVFTGNQMCGIQIARDGATTASHGDISGNAIGVNIQVKGYDLTTVFSPTVRVHDNDTNTDLSDLPVPDPTEFQF
jgi:hypothetical protein